MVGTKWGKLKGIDKTLRMKFVVPFTTGKETGKQIMLEDYTIDLHHIFADSPLAFYICNTKGYFTYFNNAAIALWGKTPEINEDLWHEPWKIYGSDGSEISLEDSPMAKTLKNGTVQKKAKLIVERNDGSTRNLLVFPRPIYDDKGKLLGAHNTLVDITDQHEAHIRREVLSAIVDSSDDAIISKDLNGIITSWNKGAERLFKYSEEEIVGKSIKMLIPRSRWKEEELILGSIANGNRVDHFETVLIDKKSNEILLSLTVSPAKDLNGHVIGASKVARDITDKLKVEEKQSILSAIVESSDDAIISKDLNGTIMSWNNGAEKIFGYSENEVLGKPITILIPKNRLKEEKAILNNIKEGKKVDHFETIRLNKQGEKINISLTVSPIKDSRGNIIGASKIGRDITARIRAKEEIEKQVKKFQILNSVGKSISKNMNVQVVLQKVTDATTKLTGAAFGAFFYNHENEQGEAMMLYTLSGAPREAFEKFGMPRHTKVFKPTFAAQGVIRSEDITQDPRYGHNKPYNGMPHGHLPVVSYMAVPVVSRSGDVIGGLIFGHPDKGVFKEEHEDLVTNIAAQAAVSLDNSKLFEKVKSFSDKKDEFIALASHELKTPLTTIKGYLQLLYKKENDPMAELFVRKSLYQVNKLNSLVEDLLNMSRIEAGKLDFNIESFDIKKLLVEIIETAGYSYQTHEIIADLGEAPVLIEADKERIEQAILNLLGNAVKYSPAANQVLIILKVMDEKVQVIVKDKGIGLSEEQQKKIFSRFYRAENTTGISGLGLGLYLTKQIIDRHKGEIRVESKSGEGSTFLFTLPLLHRK